MLAIHESSAANAPTKSRCPTAWDSCLFEPVLISHSSVRWQAGLREVALVGEGAGSPAVVVVVGSGAHHLQLFSH